MCPNRSKGRLLVTMILVGFGLAVACGPPALPPGAEGLAAPQQGSTQSGVTPEPTVVEFTTLEATGPQSITLGHVDSGQVPTPTIPGLVVESSDSQPLQVEPEEADPNAPGVTPGPPVSAGAPVEPETGQLVPGQVTVALSAASYAVGETITAAIFNGLEQTIYAGDVKSDCSIAILEQETGTGWQPLIACGVARPSLAVAIQPGQGQVVTIDPLSFNFQAISGGAGPGFGAGNYRIKFSYRFVPGPDLPEPDAVFSEVFQVQP